MGISLQIVPNQKTLAGLRQLPSRVTFAAARITLDMSLPTIPMGSTHKLRGTSMGMGVRGENLYTWYIGSYTDYASAVWNMPDSTNWTTPGTNNQWYVRTLKKHNKTIIQNAINKGWSESM